MKDLKGLQYVGAGAHIPAWHDGRSVPARDLTAAEVTSFGEALLLATGLYVKPQSTPEPKVKSEGGSQ